MEDQTLPLIGIAISLCVAIGIGVWLNSMAAKGQTIITPKAKPDPNTKKGQEEIRLAREAAKIPPLTTRINNGIGKALNYYVNLFDTPGKWVTKVTESDIYKHIAGIE